MANKLDNLKHFKKGQSGNPKGRPPETEEQKRVKNLTKAELVSLASYMLKGQRKELKAIAENPDSTIIQSMVASIAVQIIKNGDMDALDKFLNRIIGKPKEEIQVSGEGLRPVVLQFEDNGRQIKTK